MKLKALVPFVVGGCFLVAAPFQEPVEKSTEKPAVTEVAQAENNDMQMEKKIRQSLADETTLSPDAKAVTVSVKSGKAMLSGMVSNEAAKSKIEAIAVTVAGAGNVENKLEVKK